MGGRPAVIGVAHCWARGQLRYRRTTLSLELLVDDPLLGFLKAPCVSRSWHPDLSPAAARALHRAAET